MCVCVCGLLDVCEEDGNECGGNRVSGVLCLMMHEK